MNRGFAGRSRAITALLLFVLLLVPACGQVTTPDVQEEAASPQASPQGRTASDAEINRAARGEGEMADGSGGDEPSSGEGEEIAATEQAVGTSLVHRATGENSRSNSTYLSDPEIDGNPDAVVFAAPTAGTGRSYDHNIGVWYDPSREQWAIFNQDRATMPEDVAFEVVVPPEDESFVHRPAPGNTYIDDPLVNGKPEAEISVTQNWNPGGGDGVYNDHPISARYDAGRGRWEVFNEDGSGIPEGAAFNVTVSDAAQTTSGNIVSVDTGEAPEYRDFYSEGNPQTPENLVSSDSSTGAIPVVQPFNFGRDPGGPEDKTLSLTIPKIGLEDVPAFDTVSEEKLRDGTVHIPATGYPWQEGANVFIAGHRIGYENTPSYYVFFRLDEMREGDEIQLEDAAGREYLYRVTKRTVVGPDSVEVMNAEEGRSLITLQTCTLPDYEDRLIVQGELVEQRT